MNAEKALAILQSIHEDECGEWRIPHHIKAVNMEVTRSDGEKVHVAYVDDVDEFLAYVKQLIENQKEEC